MTGFGRGEATDEKFRCTVEMRSVNGRYLEIRAKLPRALYPLEAGIRDRLQKCIFRGVVDVTVALQPIGGNLGAAVDRSVARAFAGEITSLAEQLDLGSGLTVASLLRLPGVVVAEELAVTDAEKEVGALVYRAIDSALEGLLSMRRREGEKIGRVILRELNEIRSHREWIHKHREELNEKYFKKLQSRIKEWAGRAGQGVVDEGRLYQEVAFYLDRSDVTEELDRLGSHLRQCEDSLQGATPKSVGKRLEFLAQELGREVNTLGAKSDHVQVTSHVVEMKLTLEKIREQVQNLE
jgi:uncharacterized protein (TIGR00255 family)